MQFRNEEAERAYQNILFTTLSTDSIIGLGIAQMFANIVENYIDYNGEDEGTLTRGFDLALSHALKIPEVYTGVFNIAKQYLVEFWKYGYRVPSVELSDVTNCNFLLINI